MEEVFLRLNEAGIEVYDDKEDTPEPELTVDEFAASQTAAAMQEAASQDMAIAEGDAVPGSVSIVGMLP